jgi:hypothetical protein
MFKQSILILNNHINMLRMFFVIIAMIHFTSAFAQKSFNEFVDSAIGITHFLENDWAIGQHTMQAGRIPLFDSLGNIIDEPELFSTIIIYNLKNVFYVQRFNQSYDNGSNHFHACKRVLLPKNININYTVDSIQQAEKEWIYPYIFKDSNGGYIYQEDSLHSPYYALSFFTRRLNTVKDFTEICLLERLKFIELYPANLNYSINTATFTYRAFLTINRFIKENKKLIPLD